MVPTFVDFSFANMALLNVAVESVLTHTSTTVMNIGRRRNEIKIDVSEKSVRIWRKEIEINVSEINVRRWRKELPLPLPLASTMEVLHQIIRRRTESREMT